MGDENIVRIHQFGNKTSIIKSKSIIGNKKQINTENIVAKNTPMKLTMAQKKSVIVLSRHIDRFDLTVPAHTITHINHFAMSRKKY